MNSTLPIAIETYLKQSDFSASEMLLLRKLLEEDALTLRELASKTGKSTGVLDIAMKKLLRKGIAKRTVINGTMRYCIESLDAVAAWVKHDMEDKQQDLKRKHQSFEYFIASLKIDKKRPDMEYFSGHQGMEQAYLKLLESGKELVTLTPVLYRAEDDPLRAFRVEYFKRRQSRKIFQRIIAPDSPLSRRYQSRDPFEYRRTLLLPSEEFSIGFERTVVDNTVACFNFQEETACFLKYPELANAERATFEHLWAHAMAREKGEAVAAGMTPKSYSIPVSTRIGSRFRHFILSKKSVVTFSLFALLSAAVTTGLFLNAEYLNLQRMREKAVSIATTGALHFNADDLNKLNKELDWQSPEWAKVVHTLALIRRQDTDIRFAYIIRKAPRNPASMEFVADSYSINPYANTDDNPNNNVDVNQNNQYDGPDILQWPGQPYETAPPAALQAYEGPVATPSFYEDQWGKMLSGYSPIRDNDGTVVAVLAIDILSAKLDELNAETFSPFLVFLGFFLLFTLIRFAAINKPLIQECWQALLPYRRLIALWIVFLSLMLLVVIYVYQWNQRRILIEETGKRLMAIAVTAASEFDVADLDQLHWARDMKKPEYQRVFRKLNEIRNKHAGIRYAYILRATDQENLLVFVVDADTNYNLPLYTKAEIGDFTPLSEADENVPPGTYFYEDSTPLSSGLIKPEISHSWSQWGHILSGLAPIYKDGEPYAFLGFDVDIENLR